MQLIEIETFFFVPQSGPANRVDGVDDSNVMLEELTRDIFIGLRTMMCEFKCNLQHHGAVQSHPCSAVSLVQAHSVGHRDGTIEDPDIVEP